VRTRARTMTKQGIWAARLGARASALHARTYSSPSVTQSKTQSGPRDAREDERVRRPSAARYAHDLRPRTFSLMPQSSPNLPSYLAQKNVDRPSPHMVHDPDDFVTAHAPEGVAVTQILTLHDPQPSTLDGSNTTRGENTTVSSYETNTYGTTCRL